MIETPARTETDNAITSYCRVCNEGRMVANQGLGRATIAAWETQHQHEVEEVS